MGRTSLEVAWPSYQLEPCDCWGRVAVTLPAPPKTLVFSLTFIESHSRCYPSFRAQEFNTFQICPIAARFNHACQISGKVNVKYLFDESRNCISLSAAQDVPRGAELLICYTPVANQLEQQYGFQCGCLTHGKPRDEVDVDWDRFWEE